MHVWVFSFSNMDDRFNLVFVNLLLMPCQLYIDLEPLVQSLFSWNLLLMFIIICNTETTYC